MVITRGQIIANDLIHGLSHKEKFKKLVKEVKAIVPDEVKGKTDRMRIIITKRKHETTKLDVKIDNDFRRRYIDVYKELDLIKAKMKRTKLDK